MASDDSASSRRATLHELFGVDPSSAAQVVVEASPPRPCGDGLLRTDISYCNMLGELVPGIVLCPAAESAEPGACGAVICMAGTSRDAEQCVEVQASAFRRQPWRPLRLGGGADTPHRSCDAFPHPPWP
eukprot:SAG11_NODE_3562_length_2370_cov_4.250550_2_plen_129_part_00